MSIFPDTVRVIERLLELLTEIGGRVTTNAECMKEKKDLHGTLTTLPRDLNRLLERYGTRSPVKDLPEHEHVMNEEEEKVKQEQNPFLMTQRVRITSH